MRASSHLWKSHSTTKP